MREKVRRVGERIMAGFDGHAASSDVKRMIRDYGVGHVILFKRNVDFATEWGIFDGVGDKIRCNLPD